MVKVCQVNLMIYRGKTCGQLPVLPGSDTRNSWREVRSHRKGFQIEQHFGAEQLDDRLKPI